MWGRSGGIPPGLIANLLGQAILKKKSVSAHIVKLYDKYAQDGLPGRNVILDALRLELSNFEGVHLVLDALDEYSLDGKESPLPLVSDLVSLGINILITSRNVSFPEYTFPLHLTIYASKHDVELFVRDQLRKSGSLQALVRRSFTLEGEIVDRIVTISEGM